MELWQGASIYFTLGWEHILDPQGFDHMLFILALCAVFTLRQWRQVAILVTAFTIGHSLTLALAALDIFRLPADWVEFMIPLTILMTSLYNLWLLWGKKAEQKESEYWVLGNYLLALGFGLIHGMGFSNFFRQLLMESESIVKPLLFFNLGLEAGQLLVVGIILLQAGIWVDLLKVPAKWWAMILSIGTGLAALWLMVS